MNQLQHRLAAYETSQLREVFEAVRHNDSIRDFPDVVNVLVNQYFKQIKEAQQND